MAPSDTRFCWACGYALETDFTFCDLCGAPLEPADATETAGPSSAAESPPRADVDGSDHPLVQPTEATTPATGGMTTSDASLPAPTSPDATVEPSADAGSASPDRRLLWIVGGFAAALIVVVAVVTSLRGGSGGDQPTSVNETVHVPRDAPTMGWSAYADGHASVLAGRDTLYLLDGGDRPQLVAYDARDGRERWRTSVPSPRSEPDDVRTSGQILGDTIVTSSGTNDATVLAAIAASDGEVMWEQRTSGWLWSDLRDPRPGDDRVYLGEYASGAYRISSVELRDGAVAGSYRAASITTGGDVIVSVDDHDITLLDARDLRPTGSPSTTLSVTLRSARMNCS